MEAVEDAAMPEWPDAEELAAVSPQSVIDGAMTQIVSVAGRMLGDRASVSLRQPEGAGLYTPWASVDDARGLDRIQYELDRGPCAEPVLLEALSHAGLDGAHRP